MNDHPTLKPCQLDNLFGIADPVTLRDAEALFMTVASMQALPTGAFDKYHLQAIHEHLFGDLYRWAGSLRSAKSETSESGAADITATLLQLTGANHAEMNLTEFSSMLADAYASLERCAPFPHGSSSAARALIQGFAESKGVSVNWSDIASADFTRAIAASINGHPEPLREMFDSASSHLNLYGHRTVHDAMPKLEGALRTAGFDVALPTGTALEATDLVNLVGHIKESYLGLLSTRATVNLDDKWEHSSFSHLNGVSALLQPVVCETVPMLRTVSARAPGPRM